MTSPCWAGFFGLTVIFPVAASMVASSGGGPPAFGAVSTFFSGGTSLAGASPAFLGGAADSFFGTTGAGSDHSAVTFASGNGCPLAVKARS